jgi:hypothetical protein
MLVITTIVKTPAQRAVPAAKEVAGAMDGILGATIFFLPAKPLLQASPWVVVRGNHESCSRAGQGWWRMLDPRPLLPGRDCNEAANDDQGDFSAPYAVPLGQSSQLIVLDTSNTSRSLTSKKITT